MRRLSLWCFRASFFAAAFTFGAAASANEGEAVSPTRSWQPGNSWDLEVELYPRTLLVPSSRQAPAGPKKPPAPPTRFRINVRVAGIEEFGKSSCWQVDFSPSAEAPAELLPACRVLIRQHDGCTCRILRGEEVRGWLFDAIGSFPVVTGAPLGLPLELFPFSATGEYKTSGSPISLLLQRRVVQDVEVHEAFIRRGGRNDVMIKQVWKKGEKFWREYERFYRGSRDLRAKVAPNSLASLKDSAEAASLSPLAVRVDGPPMKDQDDPAGIHTDPRLQVKVSFDLKNPLVEDVLNELRKAVGVDLSRADDIQNRYPVAGSVGHRNIPAWQVMINLATSKRVEGLWEKDSAGYRLVRNGNPVLIPEEAEESTERSSPTLMLLIAAAACLLLSLSLAYWWIKRRMGRVPASTGAPLR